MKILIVDDHPIYAEGLKNLLFSWNFTEVAIARDGNQAVALAKEFIPEVVLMDIGMPEMDGIRATAEIRKENPAIQVVMLTSFTDEENLIKAIRAGASGYLIKTLDGGELAKYLSDLQAGKNPFSAGLMEILLSELRRGADPSDAGKGPVTPRLTRRQHEVLELLAEDLSYKEIGFRLFISERTIKFHVEQAKAGLGLKTREELLAFIESTRKNRT